MNIVIMKVNGIPMTNSKNVADKFGKQHRQILDSVRRVIKDEPEFGRANFCASTYTTDQNKVLDCFDMTRDGFSMIAMSLTGREALSWKVKYISAFNEMEKGLLNADLRINAITIQGRMLKDAGVEWSAMGRSIRKQKVEHDGIVKNLMSDIQFKLDV